MATAESNGERALCTGAGRGLGLEFVRQLAQRGTEVLAAVRDPARCTELAALAQRMPERISILTLDVTQEEQIRVAIEAIDPTGGGHLDLLINNAGHSPRGEEFSNLDAEHMAGVFRVNAFAPMIVARHCAPLLRRARAPRIANISSSMGSISKKDYGRHYSYSASKAALNMLTRAAAADLRDQGIVVTALHPGWVRTDLGGPKAPIGPDESVSRLIEVIDRLDADDSSEFLTWQGEHHPW